MPCIFCRLCLRPPPTSPRFPYTTLFRSFSSPLRLGLASTPGDLLASCLTVLGLVSLGVALLRRAGPFGRIVALVLFAAAAIRSEEHTSELQSLRHLVCRLLLEKKKNRYT